MLVIQILLAAKQVDFLTYKVDWGNISLSVIKYSKGSKTFAVVLPSKNGYGKALWENAE